MSGKSALIIGATGATGRHVLKELLESKDFTRVGEYGRRVTPAEQLRGGSVPSKLEQKVIDFEKVEEAGLREGRWDVVYITLGTTKAAAGGAAPFEKIDREYVINSARAAKTDDAEHKQRLVYLSSTGANASSPLLYPRSKGLTENGLAALGYSDTIVFRPGYLANADRSGQPHRLAESLAAPLSGFLSHFSSSIQIDVSLLGRSIVRAGLLGSGALPAAAQAYKAGPAGAQFTAIGNKGAMALGNASL